jgi:hypothetical protein
MGQHSSAERFSQLQDLRHNWGEVYELELVNGEFVAARRDNRRELRAKSADALREMIILDYSGNSVPRGVEQ